MSLKKKLGMGIASAVLGISLVGGGTFAYFNDVETMNNTFAAGTLDLELNKSTIIDVNNLKPGDWMNRTFKLKNKGSLDISKVLIETDYTVEGTDEDFGKHIMVEFLKNNDKKEEVIQRKTLKELKDMRKNPDAVKNFSRDVWNNRNGEPSGLRAGDSDDLKVKFVFVDNGKDQNALQGAKLKMEWKFTAEQTEGESR